MIVAISSEPLKRGPKLSEKLTTEIFNMHTSLLLYTLCADNCGSSSNLWVLFLSTRMYPLPCRFAKNPTRNVWLSSKNRIAFYNETKARSWRPLLWAELLVIIFFRNPSVSPRIDCESNSVYLSLIQPTIVTKLQCIRINTELRLHRQWRH